MYKMQRLEVSGAVRPIYGSLGVKRLNNVKTSQEIRMEWEQWHNLQGDITEGLTHASNATWNFLTIEQHVTLQ